MEPWHTFSSPSLLVQKLVSAEDVFITVMADKIKDKDQLFSPQQCSHSLVVKLSVTPQPVICAVRKPLGPQRCRQAQRQYFVFVRFLLTS